MIFSERLKELRESKKISMYALSKQLGVSDAAICKWENAITEPKASNIKNLSEFFEVSSDFLLGLEDELGVKKYSAPPVSSPAPLPPDTQELVNIYQALSPAHRSQILEYARYFAEKSGAASTRRKA